MASCLRKLPRSERDRDGCVKDEERGVGGAVRFLLEKGNDMELDSGRYNSWAAYVEGHVVGIYTRLSSAWAYGSWD